MDLKLMLIICEQIKINKVLIGIFCLIKKSWRLGLFSMPVINYFRIMIQQFAKCSLLYGQCAYVTTEAHRYTTLQG